MLVARSNANTGVQERVDAVRPSRNSTEAGRCLQVVEVVLWSIGLTTPLPRPSSGCGVLRRTLEACSRNLPLQSKISDSRHLNASWFDMEMF